MRKIIKTSFWILPFTKADWTIARTTLVFLLCFLCIVPINGHLVLTYPPARKFALDYLDNVHTSEPCGMPRGLSEPTYLEAGVPFNVTWRMAYPHQGGYIIELLDVNYDTVVTLVPLLAGREPRTTPHFQRNSSGSSLDSFHTVTLPKSVRCENCTLRLIHQAREWNNYSHDVGDEGYLFRSCADVAVMDQVATSYKCSSHGKWTGTSCLCDDLYTGNVCQYPESCLTDSDCNFRGQCVDSGSPTYSKRRCYCNAGWQGVNCSRESILKTKVFNKAHFTHRNLADGFDLYWRVLKESAEIDFIVQSASSSWLAIGWRPLTLTADCRHLFPKLPNETYSPHGASLFVDFNASSGIRPRNLEESVVQLQMDEEDSSPIFLRPRRDVSTALTGSTDLNNDNTTGATRNSSTNNSTDLHAMDCADIVIGFARNGLGQVQDSYTRDRSTPQIDAFYGGVDNLIAAVAVQESGVTTMRFRRALAAVEPADHAFINSPMHVIFARGQDLSTGFHHDPPSALEVGNISMSDFYTSNVLQYHGSSSNNRGVAEINFFDEVNDEAVLSPPCVGEWKTPVNCVGNACRYTARWEYIEESDAIYFRIESKTSDRWTGIGFSDIANHMPDSDIIIGWVEDDGTVTVGDRYAEGYRTPQLDKLQHLQNMAGSRSDAFTTIEFTRPRITNDTDDFQFMDGNCPFFMFPVDGGRFDKLSGVISKHQYLPTLSHSRICVQRCTNSSATPSVESLLMKSAALLTSDSQFDDSPNINPVFATERSDDFGNDTLPTTKSLTPASTTTTTPPPITTVPTTQTSIPALVSSSTTSAPPISNSTNIPTTLPTTLPSTLPKNTATLFVSSTVLPVQSTAASPVTVTSTVPSTVLTTPTTPVVPSSTQSTTTTSSLDVLTTPAPTAKLDVPRSVAVVTGQALPAVTKAAFNRYHNFPADRPAAEAMDSGTPAVGLVAIIPSFSTFVAATPSFSTTVRQSANLSPALSPVSQFLAAVGVMENTTVAQPVSTASTITVATLASSATLTTSMTTLATTAVKLPPPMVVPETTKVPPIGSGNWSDCRGQWKFPANCDLHDCEYVALWEYLPASDDINFYIRSSHADRWTGIGFSRDGQMPLSDVVYGFSCGDGNFSVVDGATEGHYPPLRNADSVLKDSSARLKDGQLEVFFTRPRRSSSVPLKAPFGDADQDCQFFLFPVSGGLFDTYSKSILKHMQIPLASSSRICVRNCPADPTLPDWTMPVVPVTSTTIPATTIPTTSTSTTSTTTTPSTTTLMPVIEGTPCRAIFSYPRDCNVSTCIYVAQWDYLPATDEISFIVQSNRLNTWTGIGFSDQGEMPFSDMAIGWVSTDGRPTISDRWSTGYSEPQRDFQQDLVHLGGRIRFGTQLIQFTRKRITDDSRDYQFSDVDCPYLIFPVFGGSYDENSEVINKHMDTPVISDQRICIRACRTTHPPSTNSSLANTGVDKKFILIDQNTATLTAKSDFAGNQSANPSSASLTYRKRTPIMRTTTAVTKKSTVPVQSPEDMLKLMLWQNGMGNISVDQPVVQTSTTTQIPALVAATAAPSPEDMLKLLLLQAGIGNVSIEMPSVAMTEAPRFTPSVPTAAATSQLVTQLAVSPPGPNVPQSMNQALSLPINASNSQAPLDSLISQSANQSINLPLNYASNQSTTVAPVTSSTGPPLNQAVILPPNTPTNQSMNQTMADILDTVRVGALASLVVDGTAAGNSSAGNGSGTGRTSDQLTAGISVFSTAPDTQSDGPQVKSSKNVVTGFSMGAPPNAGELMVRSQPPNPSIGPLPVLSATSPSAGPSPVIMTPEEMLKQLLKNSGMGDVSIEQALAVPDPAADNIVTTQRMSYRKEPTTTAFRDPALRHPSMAGVGGVSSAYGMSASVPIPSIMAAPSTQPQTRLRVQDRPTDPDGQVAGDVFMGDASGYVSAVASGGTAPPPASLPGGPDQGTIGDDEECGGIFRYPSGCLKETCSYIATWRPGSSIDEIEFTLESNRPDLWLGIGFSDDKLMKGSDVIYGVIRSNGQPRLVEAYAQDYLAPATDFRNNVRFIGNLLKDNRTHFHFARKLTTKNPNNFDFSNGRCAYYKFPIVGGKYDPATLMIDKHQQTPVVSPQRICLEPCRPRPKESPTGGLTGLSPARNPQANSPDGRLPSSGQNPLPPPPSSVGSSQTGPGTGLDCKGEYRYPVGCTDETCDYVAQWEYLGSTDDIKFTITTSHPTEWTGIGFNDKPQMIETDVIYGWLDDSDQPLLVDSYAVGKSTPVRDVFQDAKHQSGRRLDNGVVLSFTRKRTTKDNHDFQFTDDKCPYFIYPVRGGDFDPSSMMITKHKASPQISAQRVCFRASCGAASTATTMVRTAQPSAPVVSDGNAASTAQTPLSQPSTRKVVALAAGNSSSAAASTGDKGILSCSGEFRFPDDCSEEDTCEYIARWEYLGATDEIKFIIKTSRSKEWTGIGFNENPQMPQSDIVYGWVDSDTNQPLLIDAYADTKSAPSRDVLQDAKSQTGKQDDHGTFLSWTRKRTTKDSHDYQFTDDKCPYFIFPVRGGDYDPSSMMISQHKALPHISLQRVCIKAACAAPPPPVSGPGPAPPVTVTSSSLAKNAFQLPSGGGRALTTARLKSTSAAPFDSDMDFTTILPCEGKWNYPDSCVYPNCIYMAAWSFLDDADAIRFTIKAKAVGWTGIGFNDDMMMGNADAIIGWVTSKNTVVVTDRHCDGNVGAPMDDEQTVYDISGRREDGYQIIEFSRKRDTQDPNGQNYVFGDQKCPFFIFPIVGGSYDSYGGIQAHSQMAKPKISPQRICVRSCNIDVPRRMVISFRIVDRSYSPELDSRQSSGFKKLEAELAECLRKLLSNTPGYRGSRVIAFRQGSVIADVEIIIDPTANQTSVAGGKTIKAILTNEIQQKQQIGSFAIDPTSLTISGAEQIVLNSGTTARSDASTVATKQNAPESEVRTYAIIGGVCGIIAILLFLAFGKVWYDRKSRVARRRERVGVEKGSTNGLSGVPPLQYPRQQSRSSSVDAVRSEVYGRPKISHPRPINGEIRTVRPESTTTRRSSINPPPDYYESETPGNASRKTRRTVVADEHQLQRLSTDESDRTFTTYSSNQSRPELRDKKAASDTTTYHDWNQIDGTYHRPPDFYFMPSQRRWTQVPQNF